MKKHKNIVFLLLTVIGGTILFTSCSHNYSNGERIGLITQFSRSGLFMKSWEGHLNITQTGMNSGEDFYFSIDRKKQDTNLVLKIDSAAQFGWKVKLVYRQTKGFNVFRQHGDTDYFIEACEVLDKNLVHTAEKESSQGVTLIQRDTVVVIISDP